MCSVTNWRRLIPSPFSSPSSLVFVVANSIRRRRCARSSRSRRRTRTRRRKRRRRRSSGTRIRGGHLLHIIRTWFLSARCPILMVISYFLYTFVLLLVVAVVCFAFVSGNISNARCAPALPLCMCVCVWISNNLIALALHLRFILC